MSTQVPKTMKALIIQADHTAKVVDHPVPEIAANEVLVKVDYVALNPTDWKHVTGAGPAGAVAGCDYSGVVVAGSSKWSVGDKVAGMVHGGKFPDKGAFAEYAKVEDDLLFKVPAGMGQKEAASWGIPFTTAAQILYTRQGVPFPHEPTVESSPWFLIYGGSTSVGLFAIQIAKLGGFKVVVTASPHSFDLCKEYGADAVVNYRDADAGKQIQAITENTLTKALDCIGEPSTNKISLEGFSTTETGPKKLNTLTNISPEGEKLAKELGVELQRTVAYTLFGKAFTFLPGVEIPLIPSDRAFYAKLCAETPELIEKYGFKANPLREEQGGLEGVPNGLDLLKQNKVSGSKLVYQI